MTTITPHRTGTYTVRYLAGGKELEIREVYRWKRGDISEPVMSASSGPKDYIKNQIWALFAANPEVSTIILVRANGPAFILVQRGRHWFDVTGKQVEGVNS